MSSDFASEPQPAYVGKHRDPTQFANQENVLALETPGRHRPLPDPAAELFDQLRSEACGPSDEPNPERETRSDR